MMSEVQTLKVCIAECLLTSEAFTAFQTKDGACRGIHKLVSSNVLNNHHPFSLRRHFCSFKEEMPTHP